jgi:hypothetical protein
MKLLAEVAQPPIVEVRLFQRPLMNSMEVLNAFEMPMAALLTISTSPFQKSTAGYKSDDSDCEQLDTVQVSPERFVDQTSDSVEPLNEKPTNLN